MPTPKDKQKVALGRWLARAKASLETGDCSNLQDRHYEPKSKLIVGREVYTRTMEHCFIFRQVFRAFCFMVSLDFARNLPHAINWEVKKGRFLMLAEILPSIICRRRLKTQ